MAIEDDIRLALRDYKTVTATYPLGDPSSPVWNPPKKTLRDALVPLGASADDLDVSVAAAAASAVDADASADASAQSASASATARTQAELAALAAGNKIVTSLTSPVPANDTIELLSTDPGTQIWEVQTGAWVQIGWLGDVLFDTVSTVLASSSTFSAGQIIRTREEGFAYKAVASGGHVTNAGGQLFKVLPGARGYDAKALGLSGDGATDEIPALNKLIALINREGNSTRNLYEMVTVSIPAGNYNVKAGGIDPILVSNVMIDCDKSANFIGRDGHIFELGAPGTFVENIWVLGGHGEVKVADTPAVGGVAWVHAVNCARVFISRFNCYNWPHLLKATAPSGGIISTIYLSDIYGLGDPDFDWVDIDTTVATAASGLYLKNVNGYPYAPPTNPALVPKAVTGATQANPVVITSTGHDFATGDRIRIADVVGMTQVNDRDFNITVINANSFSLDGEDGTTHTAYTSGGRAVERHWSWEYDTAVLRLNGKWDTVEMNGCLFQHWAWLWDITATAAISFVFDRNVTWDYGGIGRMRIEYAGGSVSNLEIAGGWTFTLDGPMIEQVASGGGALITAKVTDHRIGLVGTDVFNETSGRALDFIMDNVQVTGMARLTKSAHFTRAQSANTSLTVSDCKMLNPDTPYGSGASTYLVPDVGVSVSLSVAGLELTNNRVRALTTYYDVPKFITGKRKAIITGNRRTDNGLPEYITTTSTTMPASASATTNHTGLVQTVNLRGGTITNVSKNGLVILSGAPAYSFDVGPGETWSCAYTATPTVVYSYRD